MKNPRGFAAILAVLLLVGTAHAASYTIPRDIGGVPAAECSFIGSTGAATLCSTTDPLPTSVVTTTAAPTTPTTDSVGWGQQWFTGTATGATVQNGIYPIFLADNSAVGFATADGAQTVDEWVSQDKGRTWTKKFTININSETWALSSAIVLQDGAYLVTGNMGGVTPAQSGVGRINIDGTTTPITVPGIPAGLTGGGVGPWSQGSTVLLAWVRSATGDAYLCRSLNTAATFTCAAAPYTALPGGSQNGKAFDSPAPNVWIRSKAGGVDRSIDNGVTWGSVLAGTGGTDAVVECISSLVCLFINGGAGIWRSADAGATWTLQHTALGASPLFRGFVDYGGGTVAVIPTANPRNILVTRDSGVTWTPTQLVDTVQARCALPCQGTARDGNGIYSATATFGINTDRVRYSPAIGPGQTSIVGANGIPLAIGANGGALVNQGTSTSGPTAGFWWVTLTNGSGSLGAGGTPMQTSPVQGPNLLNSSTVGAVNTAVTATLTPTASTRAHLYSLAAFCSAGSSTLTITDGATTIWRAPAGLVTTTLFTATWPVGLTSGFNSALTVTLATCGAGNTGTLTVQADQF